MALNGNDVLLCVWKLATDLHFDLISRITYGSNEMTMTSCMTHPVAAMFSCLINAVCA